MQVRDTATVLVAAWPRRDRRADAKRSLQWCKKLQHVAGYHQGMLSTAAERNSLG